MRAYVASLGERPIAEDFLAGAVVLTWSGDRDGAYACFDEAHDRALVEGRPHLAVAARERRAHHAVLFGELAAARSAVEDARRLASASSLPYWRLRCGARLAQIALDAGDAETARFAVSEALCTQQAGELLALYAPAGADLAVQTLDAGSLAAWTQDRALEPALRSEDRTVVTAAATACLMAGRSPCGEAATAVRRCLLLCDVASGAVEFLSRVAATGDPAEARIAVDALRAMPSSHRPYVEAHYLLARAHLLMRSGEADAAVAGAGEAARAFDRLRVVRWSNDAMMLLVRDQGARTPRSERRKTPSSLTRREHQVTLLIRRGASNREVAAVLGISEHTVERHVSSILARLGLRSRWQLADSPTP